MRDATTDAIVLIRGRVNPLRPVPELGECILMNAALHLEGRTPDVRMQSFYFNDDGYNRPMGPWDKNRDMAVKPARCDLECGDRFYRGCACEFSKSSGRERTLGKPPKSRSHSATPGPSGPGC